MSVRSSRISSRSSILLAVAAVHGLILWIIWRTQPMVADEVEVFTSTLFFVPDVTRAPVRPTERPAPRGSAAAPTRPAEPGAGTTPQAPLVLLPQAVDSSTAITLPPAPSARVDWTAQIPAAATAELDKEKLARKQAGALTRKFVVEDDPRNPHPDPRRGFRWNDAGINRIDTRSPIPVLHLNDRCALLLFIMPVCAIGHIDIHGDLFQNMDAVRDAREATAGPNDAP